MQATSRYGINKEWAHKQRGAAAIEFAAVFVIFFAVFYGLMSYCLPLLMMQSFNAATAEAVRRSVALSPTIPGYTTQVVALANATLTTQLGWMPTALAFNVAQDATVTFDSTSKLLTVKISYAKSKLEQVMPSLVLPGIGQVPDLPTFLTAQASLQLGP